PWLPGLTGAAAPAPLAWRWRRWRANRQGHDASAALFELSPLGLARAAELRRALGLDDESTSGLLVGLVDAKRLAAAQALLQRW
ncbi:hypothetical protein, partial [Streptomyces scabiei]|uniref:hypothetical protein n=1 Tax=Streptomyces scabiei TaxID=1930 RepID=UPI0038F6143E